MDTREAYKFICKIHFCGTMSDLTKHDVAEEMGAYSHGNLHMARRRYDPSMLLVYAIAQVFGVTIEELFDFSEE